jgi:hypothetical protein
MMAANITRNGKKGRLIGTAKPRLTGKFHPSHRTRKADSKIMVAPFLLFTFWFSPYIHPRITAFIYE